MKIKRIAKLKGYRSFRDFDWPADLPEFARYNLLFGWNGSGKTTLSTLFASLEKGETLPPGCELELVLDDGSTITDKAVGPARKLPVRVFNARYVDRTIGLPGREAEPVTPIYVFGEESVEKQLRLESAKVEAGRLQNDIEALEKRLEKAESATNSFLSERAKFIKDELVHPELGKYRNYAKPNMLSAFEQAAKAQPGEWTLSDAALLAARQDLRATKLGPLETRDLPTPDLPHVVKGVRELCERVVVGEVIEEFARDAQLSEWVLSGLHLHAAGSNRDSCQFCGSSLDPERIARLSRHFSQAFDDLKRRLRQKWIDVEQLIPRLESCRPTEHWLVYDSMRLEMDRIAKEHRHAVEEVLGIYRTLKEAVEAKLGAYFDRVELAPVDADSGARLMVATDSIRAFVAEHQRMSDELESRRLRAAEAIERHHASSWLEEHQRLLAESTEAKTELRTKRAALKALSSEMQQLEQSLRDHHKSAQSLNLELERYLGRSDLVFEVSGYAYTLLRNGVPASNLSEGERTAIAFLYFLQSLTDESFDRKQGVVVIDDPVSSLDSNAFYSAIGYLQKHVLGEPDDEPSPGSPKHPLACGQVLVFTHNFALFRELRDWFEHLSGRKSAPEQQMRKTRVLYRVRAEEDAAGLRTSRLVEMEPWLRHQGSEYSYLFALVKDAATTADEPRTNPYAVANIARRLLETFVAFKWPGKHSSLRARVDAIIPDVGLANTIYNFLNRYSHGSEGGIADHEHTYLASGGLVATQVLSAIEAVDASHVEALRALTANRP